MYETGLFFRAGYCVHSGNNILHYCGSVSILDFKKKKMRKTDNKKKK